MNALYEGGSISTKNDNVCARQTSRSVHIDPHACGTADCKISTNAGVPSKSAKSGNAMQQGCRTMRMQVWLCVSFVEDAIQILRVVLENQRLT